MPLWAGLQPGKYRVGYHVSPRAEDRGPRADVWYPAGRGGEQLRFRDYAGTLDELEGFLHAQKISDATIVEYFDAPMYARRDAPAIAGKSPLILIFQGNGQSTMDQAVLAEFLASHGFIVKTIPGAVVRDEKEMLAKAKEQADAMARVAGEPAFVIGHSFGARAALLYAAELPTLGLVSLDGGIGSANGVDELKTDKPLPPILHLYEENDPRMKPDFTFLRSLRTKSLQVEKFDLQHVHFSTWGFAAAAFPELAKATHAPSDVRIGVAAVAKRVLGFLSGAPRDSRGAGGRVGRRSTPVHA